MMNESSGLARLLMLDGERKVVRLSPRMVRRRLMRMKPREGWCRVRDEGDGKRDETGIKQAARSKGRRESLGFPLFNISPAILHRISLSCNLPYFSLQSQTLRPFLSDCILVPLHPIYCYFTILSQFLCFLKGY